MQIDYGEFNNARVEIPQASDELNELLFSPSFHNLDPKTQDRVLDEYANKLGSYHEASLATGIKIGLDCASGTRSVEVVETPASVKLKDRANNLNKSLKEYSRASSNLGYIDKMTDPSLVRASEIDWYRVDELSRSVCRHNRLGKEALAVAFGSIDDLVAAGFNRAEVEQKLSEETNKFEDYYYNPKNNDKKPKENDNRRKELRKSIKRYMDLPN